MENQNYKGTFVEVILEEKNDENKKTKCNCTYFSNYITYLYLCISLSLTGLIYTTLCSDQYETYLMSISSILICYYLLLLRDPLLLVYQIVVIFLSIWKIFK